MINVYFIISLLFVANVVAGLAVMCRSITTMYNRSRFGTDTAPSTRKWYARNKNNTVNTAVLQAWHHARQSEEETVPILRR